MDRSCSSTRRTLIGWRATSGSTRTRAKCTVTRARRTKKRTHESARMKANRPRAHERRGLFRLRLRDFDQRSADGRDADAELQILAHREDVGEEVLRGVHAPAI